MLPQPAVPRAKPGSTAAHTSEADATAAEAHATAAVPARATEANPAESHLMRRRQSRCRRAHH